MKHVTLVLMLTLGAGLAHAGPKELLDTYATAAGPRFRADARRGEAFYTQRFRVSEKMPACVSCHTEKPTQPGRHVVTGKPISPLAPVANAERFSDSAKVEKWFGRNCREVVGRDCTAAEKADFLAFMMEVR